MNEFLSRHAETVLLGDRRCTATNRDGERCGRASAIGAYVCDKHGGKSPLSIKAGRERLAILAEPALDVLYRATRNAPPCEVCKRSDADRDPNAIRAAIAILDRFGLGPHATFTMTPAPDALAGCSPEELEAHALRLLDAARSLQRSDDARLLVEARDAELIDGEPEPEQLGQSVPVVPDDPQATVTAPDETRNCETAVSRCQDET